MTLSSIEPVVAQDPDSERRRVSNLVMSLRTENRLEDAIEVCGVSLKGNPENKNLRNILSDLYMQNGQPLEAYHTLVENIKHLTTYYRDIKGFGSRYYRLQQNLSKDQFEQFTTLVELEANSSLVRAGVRDQLKTILAKTSVEHRRELSPDLIRLMQLAKDDSNFNDFVRKEKELEDGAPEKLILFLDAIILNRKRVLSTWRIDLYCVSIYERSGLLSKALKISEELLDLRIDPVAVRSLLRICRRQRDYTAADILFEREPSLLRNNDFNVMYELVYYFEHQEDFHSAQSVLRTITRSFATNLPALRTARNFYIRFGMIEEATSLANSIALLYGKRSGGNQKYITEVTESETALASKLQELYSQLEHQKQLAAISDLTTGISHELGQPLTNIRYTIQFYKRKLEKSLTLDLVNTVFGSILEETERMGGLIRRLSPLTSSKGIIEPFDVMDRIRKRVDGEKPRIVESGVRVAITPKSSVLMMGDPVKFDQLISNLLLNAIDAINERVESRENEIEIHVTRHDQEISISFSDTGVGIPAANRHKIFDPFFSTKAPGHGEGLGLFIVWNLLKMLGGRVSVDTQYRTGARFLISIPTVSTGKGHKHE
ncbi:sensor histidine kinase [Pseudomonas juntendi]|uniref:histidine kinase n=1 Tax=Pseudomonas juntendi TaxID=2666183 RepID=A0AAJ5S6M9_9PSED|nr:HAMP domain-containing sensor histidine kinase [Pseudomonas juntendi]QOH73010.1 HAMP domain-containing histidine kinase [Pseudomonas putida]WEA21222.1 HAMP domain-containing sensor histidine kinase [Pseudomonas juntendi]